MTLSFARRYISIRRYVPFEDKFLKDLFEAWNTILGTDDRTLIGHVFEYKKVFEAIRFNDLAVSSA